MSDYKFAIIINLLTKNYELQLNWPKILNIITSVHLM